MRSMKCAAARLHEREVGAGVAAGVEQHDDRVVGRADRQDLARAARFLNHEIVGADVDQRPVARVGDAGQRNAARARVLVGRLGPRPRPPSQAPGRELPPATAL